MRWDFQRTKYNFRTVEDAYQLVPWGFIVIDLEDFYRSMSAATSPMHELSKCTFLSERDEALTSFPCCQIEMFRTYPAEQLDALLENLVTFQVIGSH